MKYLLALLVGLPAAPCWGALSPCSPVLVTSCLCKTYREELPHCKWAPEDLCGILGAYTGRRILLPSEVIHKVPSPLEPARLLSLPNHSLLLGSLAWGLHRWDIRTGKKVGPQLEKGGFKGINDLMLLEDSTSLAIGRK